MEFPIALRMNELRLAMRSPPFEPPFDSLRISPNPCVCVSDHGAFSRRALQIAWGDILPLKPPFAHIARDLNELRLDNGPRFRPRALPA